MLRAGLRLPPPDLAIVCASHYGEDFHVARVRALLHGAGLTESVLHCPPAWPISEVARQAAAGPARVSMNCSGKHTGMVLTCLAAGWPIGEYWQPSHPLQVQIRSTVEDLAGEKVAAVGVDGCGAPVLALSLTALARAFLRLVWSPAADAMRGHPELVAGTGADDTRLMRGVPGLLAKGGAEGVVAVAVPGAGAVALKIDDGALRARMPVLVTALHRLGLSAPVLDELADVPVYGGGVQVGTVCAVANWG
jgi:L-asparaginase II